MFGVIKIGIKLYNQKGELKSNGFSNLILIPKKNIEASQLYGMYWKVKPYKDGYRIASKNPISL